ncbi:MAG: hypothetical protein GY835_07755 [bacterium]|nr:hypothetical protein [bacterium]
MKHPLNILILVLTLLALTLPPTSVQARSDDEYDETFAAEPGGTIEFSFDQGGSLNAAGWDRDEIRIVCYEDHNGLDAYEIELEETRNGFRFIAEPKSRRTHSTNLEVQVRLPHRYSIEIESAGGGIEIIDVEGEFNGHTGGGSIVLHNVKGKANLRTGGSSIKITDSTLDGRVKTGGGKVLVRNVIGTIKATSGGGIVSYENVRDHDGNIRGSKRFSSRDTRDIRKDTIIQSTAGGSIDVDEAPSGAIVSTGGGSIDVRDARRFVDAKTGGGDIEIEVEDGWVHAKTGAGDIYVKIEGSLGDTMEDIELITGLGEIELFLPRQASIELDIELAYTRRSRGNYEIDCDFEIDIEETEDWDYSYGGNPKKYILGTAEMNGGRQKVYIRTTNGNVVIKTH